MDVTKPYEFIGLGAMDVTKPYEFIGQFRSFGSSSRWHGEIGPESFGIVVCRIAWFGGGFRPKSGLKAIIKAALAVAASGVLRLGC